MRSEVRLECYRLSITYEHQNGFSAVLYGKSSMSILENKKEVLHTGNRGVNTEKEVMNFLDKFPEFMNEINDRIDSLSGTKE